jgi:hypothetical protein
MSDEDKVESPLNCTRRNPKCTRKIGDIVGNLKAPLSIEALAKEACSGSEIGQLDCIEGLLLSLIPSKYNSNDAADTPGGKHLVRPAQVRPEVVGLCRHVSCCGWLLSCYWQSVLCAV